MLKLSGFPPAPTHTHLNLCSSKTTKPFVSHPDVFLSEEGRSKCHLRVPELAMSCLQLELTKCLLDKWLKLCHWRSCAGCRHYGTSGQEAITNAHLDQPADSNRYSTQAIHFEYDWGGHRAVKSLMHWCSLCGQGVVHPGDLDWNRNLWHEGSNSSDHCPKSSCWQVKLSNWFRHLAKLSKVRLDIPKNGLGQGKGKTIQLKAGKDCLRIL